MPEAEQPTSTNSSEIRPPTPTPLLNEAFIAKAQAHMHMNEGLGLVGFMNWLGNDQPLWTDVKRRIPDQAWAARVIASLWRYAEAVESCHTFQMAPTHPMDEWLGKPKSQHWRQARREAIKELLTQDLGLGGEVAVLDHLIQQAASVQGVALVERARRIAPRR